MTGLDASLRRPLAAVALAVAVGCPTLEAADDRIMDAEAAPSHERVVRFGIPNVALPGGGELDLGAMFDQQVFGRSRGQQLIVRNGRVVARSPASAPDHAVAGTLAELRGRGQARIARLEQICGLDAGQRQHLELALESDLRRVAGEIDTVRQNYAGQRLAGLRQPVDQQRLQALQQDAARCRAMIDGAFWEDSLLAAVGSGLLDSAQRELLADWVAGHRHARWEAMVRLVVGQLDETCLGLSERQHAAIVELLLADVPPLTVFDDGRLPRGGTGFQNVLVLARLGRAGEPHLRPLLDPRQWGELGRRIDLAGPFAKVERMLLEQGILEGSGDPAMAMEVVP
jgi:hypothetical protein